MDGRVPASRTRSKVARWLNAKPGQTESCAAIASAAAFLAICLGCASFQFGGTNEVAPASPSTPSDGALSQSGTGRLLHNNEEQDVFYPVPYISPPNLVVHDSFSCVMVTEQKPDRFRVKANGPVDFTWKARGVPVPTVPVQLGSAPTVKFENAVTVPAAAPGQPPEPTPIEAR